MAHVFEAELLERESELEQLRDLVSAASAGTGRVALLEGPAGIGKSSLLAAALVEAEQAGFETARARSSELERDFAFGLVRQLFEPRLARMGAKQRSRLFAGAAGLAAPLFDSADLTPRGEAPHAILHGLYWLTANLAGDGPLALAVDDAHWADAPSLRFLAYLVNRLDDLPIFLVLVARPFEPGAEVDLLEELAASPQTRTIRPGPLSSEAVEGLVHSALGTAPDRSFSGACATATGGNPLFLHELLVTLTGDRVAPLAAESDRVIAMAPRSVVRSVARRMRRLTPEAGQLAHAVAVLGDGAEPATVAAMAGLGSETALEAAAALGRADILRPGVLEFAHPVVRAAIYSELASPERARQHRAAARILADRGAAEDEIALHVLATEPSEDPWAVEVLRRAAKRAHARGAPDVAATYLERALAEPPATGDRKDVLVELGMAELDANRWGGFGRMRQALELADDPPARGRVALRLGRSQFSWGDLEGAANVFEEAIAKLGNGDPQLSAELDAHFITAAMATPALAHGVRDRIVSLWEDPDQISDPVMLAGLGAAAAQLFPPAWKGAGLAERALASGRLSIMDDPAMVAVAATPIMTAGRLDQAKAVWDQAVAEARARGATFTLGFSWTMRASVQVRRGDLVEAEADARGAFEDLSKESALPLPFVLTSLIDILVERGELEDASQLVDRYHLGGELPNLVQMNYLLDSIGRLRIAQNRLDEGISSLRECGRRLEEWGTRNPGFVPWRTNLAVALAATGQQEQALELVHEEIELAREFEVVRELGMALRAAGLVEGGAPGLALLRASVEVLEDSPAKLEHARALTDLGAALRRAGQRAGARDPLRTGLDLAQSCGASALAERAHSELVASGARPRRMVLRGVDALTASERRVAEMASEGLTNKEIAQALFVTEKTVEGHLGHAYRKLDISSRSELPKALIRQPDAAAV